MTDPYQQTNINVPMSGARYVAQSDIDTTLAVPAVVLNADDEFIIASDDDDITDYQINLPEVTEVTGKDIVFKARTVPAIGVTVTIGTRDGSGQTIEGVATVVLGGPGGGNTLVVRADPPDNTVDPITQPTNWSIIRGPSAP